MSPKVERPANGGIERIASVSPGLLNPLYAYFVMGWRTVRIGSVLTPHTGMDFLGKMRKVPDYVGQIGVDSVVLALFRAPASRDPLGLAGVDYMFEEDAK